MSELEARVGIGQFPPRLQGHYARFYWLLKHNRLNPTIPSLTLLVSVLVSANQIPKHFDHAQTLAVQIAASDLRAD